MNNFIKRVLFGLVGIPVFLFLLCKGGYFLLTLLGALVVIGSLEFLAMLNKKGVEIPKILVIFNLLIFVSLSLTRYLWVAIFFVCLFVFLGIYNLTKEQLQGSTSRLTSGLFSALYIAVPMGCVYMIREINLTLLVAVLVMVWVTDTFAYLLGMSLGRHRGFIKASPKKSLEGFVGGFFFCVLAGYIFSIFTSLDLYFILLAAVFVGFFAQLGDVFASALKRDCGVKDSGSILPGHGGVIDRFDSLLLVAPIVYLLVCSILA